MVARLDPVTRRARTLSRVLEEGYATRAADMPGAGDLMMRIYAAMAQKERELISERTQGALAAIKTRATALAEDWGYRPIRVPTLQQQLRHGGEVAERAAHRLALEVERLRGDGVVSQPAMARALTERGVVSFAVAGAARSAPPC
jgi:DNA invertase Pin-like site-specific DNA recombinase